MKTNNKNEFESSIKQLLQDHPGYHIIIDMNPNIDNDIVFIKVYDTERGLALTRTFKDIVIYNCLLFDKIPIDYKDLFKPFDTMIEEEDKNNV